MKISEPALLTNAVTLWTVWRHSAAPCRNDSILITRFGDKVEAQLISKLKALGIDFYSSDANLTAASFAEMGAIAIEQFKSKHPEVPNEIAPLFAWCYTFDYK